MSLSSDHVFHSITDSSCDVDRALRQMSGLAKPELESLISGGNDNTSSAWLDAGKVGGFEIWMPSRTQSDNDDNAIEGSLISQSNSNLMNDSRLWTP